MFAFLLPQEGALFVTGQWAGGWEVELGRAGLGLPGELGSDSGWGFPASLSCCSLPCGEPGFALRAPSTPCPATESWSVLTTGELTHWLLPRPRLLPVHLAVCLLRHRAPWDQAAEATSLGSLLSQSQMASRLIALRPPLSPDPCRPLQVRIVFRMW